MNKNYVISVNGVYKGKKNFYYITNTLEGLRFTYNVDDARKFDSVREALQFARDNYMALLTAMASNNAKMVTKTLAVREMIFKFIPKYEINESVLEFEKTWDENVDAEVKNEAEASDNAQHESSNNDIESESGMENEMPVDAV